MANTDKFIKGARRFSTTVGVGGVANGTDTTIPITTFPSDYSDNDAVAVVIDRVNTSGTLTPDTEEVVIGVKSGSNLINCVRGVEGTAGAHSAGAVVEIKLFKSTWNRFIEGILVEHNQDGTHSDITADSVTSSGAVSGTTFTGSGTATLPKVQGAASAAKFQAAVGEYSNGNSGTSKTIDWANGDRQSVTLTGNCTFTFSNAAAGQTLTLRVVQDGTGSRTATWPTLKWPSGTVGTPGTSASDINLYIFYFDGTNYLAQLAADFS